MISENDLISLGILRRTHYKDLPPFIFVKRDGLFVPYHSEDCPLLIGEEAFALRSDMQEEGDEALTWQDLEGYELWDRNEQGEWIRAGVIASVDESTINTLATLEDGRMLPLHEDFIMEIDEEARILRVQLPFVL